MTTTLFKAITIPSPDGRWSHSTTNTETLTLEGLIKSLWWTMTLGKFSGVSSAATVLNKQHFYCWKKSTHALTVMLSSLECWGGYRQELFHTLLEILFNSEVGFFGCFKVTYSLSETFYAWEKYISLGNNKPHIMFEWLLFVMHFTCSNMTFCHKGCTSE